MKTLMLFVFIAISYAAFCQDYTVVKKITKKCSTVFNGENSGLLYNKKIVEKMDYSEYDIGDGLIVFNKDTGSVCWSQNGEMILRFEDANMSLTEDNDYLLVYRNENERALYSRVGNVIVPFGRYEFEFYENGVLAKDNEGRQAFFNEYGREILPFDSKTITMIDEIYNIVAVSDKDTTRMLLSDDVNVPHQFRQFSDYAFALNHEVTIEEYLYFVGNQQYIGYLTYPDSDQAIPVSEFFPDTNRIEAKLRPLYRTVFPLLTDENYPGYKVKIQIPTGSAELNMPFKLDKKMKDLAKFPVAGITKEQAKAYCSWLTIICSEYGYYSYYDSQAIFRLPTVKEWEMIADQGLDGNSRGENAPDSLSENDCMLFIYNSSVQCQNYTSYLKASKGGGSVPSESNPIDEENRYQVFGNVAEMTSENGVAKGGSYFHNAKEANLKNTIRYFSPEPWLGFRIVGEYHY